MRSGTLTTMLLLIAAATTATAAPPPKKPAPKPAPKPAAPGVKGTAQLPGDVGQVGVTYSLANGGSTFNLTIHDMYFVATRMLFEGKVVFPEADKKFLVMDFTVQNPNSGQDLHVGTQNFKVTAVDASNQNSDDDYQVMNPLTNQDLDIDLKPGQKVAGKKYIVVPAGVQIPKLILDWGAPRVMRFDLHGVVKPVEAVVHDPADTTGSIALATIPNAQVGTTYPCGPFDLTIEKFEFVDSALQGNAPDDGKRYLVATLRAKNATREDSDVNMGNGFTAFVMDSDGDKIDRAGDYLKASADEPADSAVAAGIEKRFRIYWPVSKSGSLKSLTLYLGDSYRHLVYDLSGVK